jgi:hypothetical protein
VLYHEGKGYPKGAVIEVDAEDAQVLMGRGEAGKPGGLAAEKKAQEQAEASRPRCDRCRRLLMPGRFVIPAGVTLERVPGEKKVILKGRGTILCPRCVVALADPPADPYDPDLPVQSFYAGAYR